MTETTAVPVCLVYRCRVCEIWKPHTAFVFTYQQNRDRVRRHRRRTICRTCENARSRERYGKGAKYTGAEKRMRLREEDPERFEYLYGRTAYLRRTYGITPAQYDEMSERQGHRCAVCPKRQDETRHGLVVDHCHETGRIRGLLCERHNLALGNIGDTEAAVLRLLAYVRGEAA